MAKPADDVAGPDPDWVCLENCKQEMQSCIDECGVNGTAVPEQYAEQGLAKPMPQDSNSDIVVRQDSFHKEPGASEVGGQHGILPREISAPPATPMEEENDDNFISLPLPEFDYWDADGDGVLSVNEAYRLYHFELEQHDLLSKESPADVVSSFEDFVRAVDENGDGVVSREEFDDEDDGAASVGTDKAVHSTRTVHTVKTAQPSKKYPPAKAAKRAKTLHSVMVAQSPASHEGFLSRHGEHDRNAKGSNSIREMARMMTALNREVRGL